jgi:hypothetical protein
LVLNYLFSTACLLRDGLLALSIIHSFDPGVGSQ